MEKFELVTIQSKSGKTRMTFSPEQGGLGTSLIVMTQDGERELLYFPKDHSLRQHSKMCGGWPFMFPICGRLSRTDGDSRYLYDGKIYEMKIHGFAHLLPWQVLEHSSNRVTLCLRDDEETHQQYPFHFEVILIYEIDDNKLTCTQHYHNTGQKPLPYYAGFHPYFYLPFSKDEVQLSYHPKRRFAYNPKLTDVIGELPIFSTPAAISLPELNESLVELSLDKTVTLSFPDQTKIKMRAEGTDDPNLFPYLQLYHIQQEPFLCIEPWMGHPNMMNAVFGVRWLQPGQSEQGLLTFEFENFVI